MGFINFTDTAQTNEPGVNEVPPVGPKNARIAFIGEAPGRTEVKYGKPFVGDAGRVFDHCLHEAGIIRAQCYVTNFIKTPIGKGIETYVGRNGLTQRGIYWRERLADELRTVEADLLVPLGGPAAMAVAGVRSISSSRGYLTYALDDFGGKATLPVLHPASCLYGGSYINKYYIAHDFRKALSILGDDSGVKEPHIPAVRFPTTVGEVERMVQEMRDAGIFAFDIEVANFEVSCISFASTSSLAYSVLLCDKELWTDREELQIWTLLASILEDSSLAKVGQNLIFDIHFLLTHQHIYVRGPIVDTMIGHSLVYPDFLKGLRFLASIHTNVPDWKDMVKFKGGNVKKES